MFDDSCDRRARSDDRSTDDGANVRQYDWWGGDNQRWLFNEVGE